MLEPPNRYATKQDPVGALQAGLTSGTVRRSLAALCAVALATVWAIAMPAGAPRAEPARVDPVAAGWNAAALDALIDYVARTGASELRLDLFPVNSSRQKSAFDFRLATGSPPPCLEPRAERSR